MSWMVPPGKQVSHTSFLPLPHPYVYWSPNLINLTSMPSLEFISLLYLHCYFFFLDCVLIIFHLHYMSVFYLVSQSLIHSSHSSQNDLLKHNCGHITRLRKFLSKASFCLGSPKSRAWPTRIIMIWPCLSLRFINTHTSLPSTSHTELPAVTWFIYSNFKYKWSASCVRSSVLSPGDTTLDEAT